MAHSVKAMNSHRKEAFSRIFNRHRFENDELERLFQRYIFKLQHGSISSFVALFIVLTAVLAVLSFVLVQAPTVDNVYHSLHCLVFVVIFTFLATKSMEDVYLGYVCYCILLFSFLFAVASLPVSFGLAPVFEATEDFPPRQFVEAESPSSHPESHDAIRRTLESSLMDVGYAVRRYRILQAQADRF